MLSASGLKTADSAIYRKNLVQQNASLFTVVVKATEIKAGK